MARQDNIRDFIEEGLLDGKSPEELKTAFAELVDQKNKEKGLVKEKERKRKEIQKEEGREEEEKGKVSNSSKSLENKRDVSTKSRPKQSKTRLGINSLNKTENQSVEPV